MTTEMIAVLMGGVGVMNTSELPEIPRTGNWLNLEINSTQLAFLGLVTMFPSVSTPVSVTVINTRNRPCIWS